MLHSAHVRGHPQVVVDGRVVLLGVAVLVLLFPLQRRLRERLNPVVPAALTDVPAIVALAPARVALLNRRERQHIRLLVRRLVHLPLLELRRIQLLLVLVRRLLHHIVALVLLIHVVHVCRRQVVFLDDLDLRHHVLLLLIRKFRLLRREHELRETDLRHHRCPTLLLHRPLLILPLLLRLEHHWSLLADLVVPEGLH